MADREIHLVVNGEKRTVTTDPRRPLLDVLREDLGLTGTKYGCGQGQCAACTVLIEGKTAFSCLTAIGDMEGKAVATVEGLAKGKELHPVQEAFLAEKAYQCGYCTPGMIMATVGLLAETPRPSEAQIVATLNRHLCRCCGYPNIVKAVKRAAGAGKEQP
jgi:aerobic-type carbon monoxide dehydrogenase small subunit (CoxS/CutS family)